MGVVALLGLSMILLAQTVVQEKLNAKLEKRGMVIARSVARSSLGPLLGEEYISLALMAREEMHAEEGVEYIFIVNAHGDVVAHTFESGFPVDLQSLLTEKTSGNAMVVQQFESEKGHVDDIMAPLLNGRAGAVHVGISDRSIQRDITEITGMIIGVMLGLMALATVLVLVIATSVTKPIHLLAIAVQGLELGDLSTRVPVRSEDEVGQLADAFNKMAGSRMQAEAALQREEKKLRDITSSVGEGVIVLDDRGLLEFMNPEAELLLGWSESELKGKDIHDLTHYQKADGSQYFRDECPNVRVLTTGDRVTMDEDIFMHKEGRRIPVSYISTPIRDEDKIKGVVIAFQDSTVRKQREADREQLLLAYQDALENVKTLKGLIPICASCKKIRDDSGYWGQIEAYIAEHSDAEFSHGICPDCAKKIYPNYYKEKP